MLIIASSYAGAWLMLQLPISLLATLLALICAFNVRRQRISTGSAVLAITLTLVVFALEWLDNQWEHLGSPGNRGFLCLLVLPPLVSLGIIAMNRWRNASDE